VKNELGLRGSLFFILWLALSDGFEFHHGHQDDLLDVAVVVSVGPATSCVVLLVLNRACHLALDRVLERLSLVIPLVVALAVVVDDREPSIASSLRFDQLTQFDVLLDLKSIDVNAPNRVGVVHSDKWCPFEVEHPVAADLEVASSEWQYLFGDHSSHVVEHKVSLAGSQVDQDAVGAVERH